MKRIFRYFKGTINYRLTYSKDTNGRIIEYCDAEWATDQDRRSYTAYIFLFQGAGIFWFSRKQRTVVLSTIEAEHMALATAAQERLWFKLEEKMNPQSKADVHIQ